MSVAFEGAFIIYESELFSAFLSFSGFPCLITNWEQVQSKLSVPLIPISTHDRAMFLVIHVHYFIVVEVTHNRTMILEIQVYYVYYALSPEVSYNRTMLLIN